MTANGTFGQRVVCVRAGSLVLLRKRVYVWSGGLDTFTYGPGLAAMPALVRLYLGFTLVQSLE